MLIKRDLLQFRRFGMGILATCLTSVVTPQQLLATPLKAHSFNTKQNSDVSPATVQLKHAEYLLAEQSIDSETFWKNYSDNTRSDEYNLSSKQVIQAKTKKPVEVKQRSGYSINSNLSTLGFGVEGTKQFTSNFNGRLGVNFAGLQVNQKQTNIKYGADLKFFSISALGDWYPWKSNGFHLTTGLVYNNNRADGTGEISSSQTFNIGNKTFTVSQVEKLKGKVRYSNPIAPYIGIGYGNPVRKGSQLSFSIDVGVMFTGSPDVDLSSAREGQFAQLAQAIKKEENRIKNDLDKFSVYPVLSLGVSYQF